MTTAFTIATLENIYNTVTITTTTNSTSTQTGALIVSGGVGIGGNLNVGGAITATSLTIQYTTVTQSLVTSPDIFTITNATVSLSTTTGALTVTGGVGIGGGLYVGSTSTIYGIGASLSHNGPLILDMTSSGTFANVTFQQAGVFKAGIGADNNGNIFLSAGASLGSLIEFDAAAFTFNKSSFYFNDSAVNKWLSYNNATTPTNGILNIGAKNATATSTSTGTLTVQGGVGISGNLYLGGNGTAGGAGFAGDLVLQTGGLYSFKTSYFNSGLGVNGAITIGVAATQGASGTLLQANGGSLSPSWVSSITITTATITGSANSTSTNTGALTVQGGVGIGGGLNVGGTITATNITNSGLSANQIVYAGTGGLLTGSSTFVYSGGNVGIGTSSPANLFQVYQATTATGAAKLEHVNGNYVNVQPSYNYYAAYNHIFSSLSGSTEYARFDNNGFFGIGTTTTNPISGNTNAKNLTLSGDGTINSADGRLVLVNPQAYASQTVGTTTAGRIYFILPNASGGTTANAASIDALSGGSGGTGGYGLSLRMSYKNDNGSSAVGAFLDYTGRFVVGTNSIGAYNNSRAFQVANGMLIGNSLYTYAALDVDSSGSLTLTSNAYPANVGVNTNVIFKLGSSGGGGPNEIMRITSGGQLLVGSTSDTDPARVIVATNSSVDATKIDAKNLNSGALIEVMSAGLTGYSLNGWHGSAVIEGTAGTSATNALVFSAYNAPMQFQINSRTPAMTINNSGYVGIGTTSPGSGLVLSGTSGTVSSRFQITDGTDYLSLGHWDGANVRLEASGGRPMFLTAYSAPITFGISGSETMRISTSGNVGIGTSSPSNKITMVVSSATSLAGSSDGIIIQDGAGVYNTQLVRLGSSYSYEGVTGNGGMLYHYGGDFYFLGESASGTAFRWHTGGSQRMVLNSSGQLGIGTSSPSYTLDVTGNTASNIVGVNIRASTAGDYGKFMVRYGGTEIMSMGGTWSGSAFSTFINGAYAPLVFNIAGSEAARFDSSGNFLVGTTSNTVNSGNYGAVINKTTLIGPGATPATESFTGGSFMITTAWDSTGTTHTITSQGYDGNDNSAGLMVINTSNKKNPGKVGTMLMQYYMKRGDNTYINIINTFKSSNLTSFTATTSINSIIVTTDSDCAINYVVLGGV
jgi:fibronectin-binding autotransporter adhesin